MLGGGLCGGEHVWPASLLGVGSRNWGDLPLSEVSFVSFGSREVVFGDAPRRHFLLPQVNRLDEGPIYLMGAQNHLHDSQKNTRDTQCGTAFQIVVQESRRPGCWGPPGKRSGARSLRPRPGPVLYTVQPIWLGAWVGLANCVTRLAFRGIASKPLR